MSKHTPGPWTVNPLDLDQENNLIFAPTTADGSRHLVASVSTNRYTTANSRLIAAAPDLLEALEIILSYDDTQTGADAAKKAIAKTKGE